MRNDPIVEELHEIRRQLAAECDNDLHKIAERAMQSQKRHGARLVSPPPRKAKPAVAAPKPKARAPRKSSSKASPL